MRRIKQVPTKTYIKQLLNEPSVTRILEDWSVEYTVITNAITIYLENMGIFEIDPIHQKKEILETIKSQILNNHAIQKRKSELLKIQEESNARRRKSAS